MAAFSTLAPTAAATAILGSHCGGRRGAGGLQRGQRAERLRRLLGNGRAGARTRRGGSRSAINALGWSHVTAGVCGVTSGPSAWRRLHERPTRDYISQNANSNLVYKRPRVGHERVNYKSRHAVNIAALLCELVAPEEMVCM
ncbi:uncharacterized protein LOC118551632 [Halichoerus grypus]